MPKNASALPKGRDHDAATDDVDAQVRRGRRQGVSGAQSEVEHAEVTQAQAELAEVELNDLDESDLDDVAELDDNDLQALLAGDASESEHRDSDDEDAEPDDDDDAPEAEADELVAA